LIVPCGIDGVTMTSIERQLTELGRPAPSMREVEDACARAFGTSFGLSLKEVGSDDPIFVSNPISTG
jgi:lipoate-protein ligase B